MSNTARFSDLSVNLRPQYFPRPWPVPWTYRSCYNTRVDERDEGPLSVENRSCCESIYPSIFRTRTLYMIIREITTQCSPHGNYCQ